MQLLLYFALQTINFEFPTWIQFCFAFFWYDIFQNEPYKIFLRYFLAALFIHSKSFAFLYWFQTTPLWQWMHNARQKLLRLFVSQPSVYSRNLVIYKYQIERVKVQNGKIGVANLIHVLKIVGLFIFFQKVVPNWWFDWTYSFSQTVEN